MMMDCVAGETYFGVRALDDVVLCAGTVIVKRADAATGAAPAGAAAVVGDATGTLCALPPPEQLHSPHKTSSARARVRIEVLR
jgi:hypothetical protein